MSASIDVIIPSYRLNPATLLPILNLDRPAGLSVKFYLISDNPANQPDPAILALVDNESIFLLVNEVNSGASFTRNRGIEAGHGEWLLFLDDDIDVPQNLLEIYAGAAMQWPDEIGFIGVVDMPTPPTMFARAVSANGSMSIFTVARQKPSFAWGATANIMIKRSAVGEVRFSEAYPKSGGGEEVEFFLRARARSDYQNYRSLPEAAVEHPWWSNGKTDFVRFFRYGQGNSFLAPRNKAYSWRDLLNTSETLLISFIALIASLHTRVHLAVFDFIAATILIEYVVTILRVRRNTKQTSPVLAVYCMLLRNIYESGILYGNLRRGRLQGIGERFNYEGGLKNGNFRLNRFKIIKLVLYAATITLIILCT